MLFGVISCKKVSTKLLDALTNSSLEYNRENKILTL